MWMNNNNNDDDITDNADHEDIEQLEKFILCK